jgi:hypothetical protein
MVSGMAHVWRRMAAYVCCHRKSHLLTGVTRPRATIMIAKMLIPELASPRRGRRKVTWNAPVNIIDAASRAGDGLQLS